MTALYRLGSDLVYSRTLDCFKYACMHVHNYGYDHLLYYFTAKARGGHVYSVYDHSRSRLYEELSEVGLFIGYSSNVLGFTAFYQQAPYPEFVREAREIGSLNGAVDTGMCVSVWQ